MISSPLCGIRENLGPSSLSAIAPGDGADGRRVAPLTSSACRLGRAEATTLPESESEDGAELRRSRGASESDEFGELLPLLADELGREEEDDEDDEDELPDLPVPISARGPPSSAPETARRGLDVLLPLDEELSDDELEGAFERPASSEPDDDRRSRGRSGSLSSDELDERLATLLLSSAPEERRKTGLFGFDELFPDDEADEEEPLSVRGSGAVSSVCSDASE
jgi:hypothetical protein